MPSVAELGEYYEVLRRHYGPAAGDGVASAFEAVLAAVAGRDQLDKVEQNLRAALLSAGLTADITPAALWSLPPARLTEALRPAGFAPARAGRLRSVLAWLTERAGLAAEEGPPDDASLGFLRAFSLSDLRDSLLTVRGLGPESVDFFLLYGLNYPVFAVNLPACRLLRRHGFLGEEAEYQEIQELFSRALPEEAAVYRDCRFFLKRLGAEFCRKSGPRCAACPLKAYMEYEPCD